MKHELGFSLVEVIVALFILSTATTAFIRVSSGSVQAAGNVEVKYVASIVADNQLVKVFGEDVPMRIGVVSGTEEHFGRQFEWERTISHGPRPGVLAVRLRVRREGDDLILASLSALKAETLR